MRVLIAGRNAKVLAQAAGAFANDLTIETATTKAAAVSLLERAKFDLVIACERLSDGSGLEVLSHVAVNTPNTLRIFAARPSTLQLLKNELGFFGLFRTFPYPINFRKLWSTLNLAGNCLEADAPEAAAPSPQSHMRPIRHVVLDSAWDMVAEPNPDGVWSVANPSGAANGSGESGSGAVGNTVYLTSAGKSTTVGPTASARASTGAASPQSPALATDRTATGVRASATNRASASARVSGAGPESPGARASGAMSASASARGSGAMSASAGARASAAARVSAGARGPAATPASGSVRRLGIAPSGVTPMSGDTRRSIGTPTLVGRRVQGTAGIQAGSLASAANPAGRGARGSADARTRRGSLAAPANAVPAGARAPTGAQRNSVGSGADFAPPGARASVGNGTRNGTGARNANTAAGRAVAGPRPPSSSAVRASVAARTVPLPGLPTTPVRVMTSRPPPSDAVATSSGAARASSRIPESEAFKRARAIRNEARAQREESATNSARGRREPSVTNESLAQLARLAVTRRPTFEPRAVPGGRRRRAALFVGSGVFAGGAAAVLTFFMVNTNNSIGQSPVPIVASIDHPVPQTVLPWQAPPPQPTPTAFVRNETVTPPVAADMEVEAEAASEPVGIEPGHPGPPPPNPPPGPSEPPMYDAAGMPIDE